MAAFVDHSRRLKGFAPPQRPPGKAAEVAEGEAQGTAAAAAEGEGEGVAEEGGATWRHSWRSAAGDADVDDEVPFMATASSGPATATTVAAAAAAGCVAPAGKAPRVPLSVNTLRLPARGAGGSFYDSEAADVAASAAATAAAAAVSSALAQVGAGTGRRSLAGSLRVSFSDVAPPAGKPSLGGPTSLAEGEEEEEEEVETLFSQGEGGAAAADFDARWQQSVGWHAAMPPLPRPHPAATPLASQPGTARSGDGAVVGGEAGEQAAMPEEEQRQLAVSASAAASAAAAHLVRSQISAMAALRAAVASRGSTRDLLGRLQPGAEPGELAAAPHATQPHPPAEEKLSAALLSRVPSKHLKRRLLAPGSKRGSGPEAVGAADGASGAADGGDLEAGLGGTAKGDASPKAGSASDGSRSTLQDLRLRVLNSAKRHFRSKRLSGLLSPEGLRIAM